MEKIVYNLVRNLLIVKCGFKDKQCEGAELIQQSEYILALWRNNVLFETASEKVQLKITDEEKRENKPNKIALRYFHQISKLIKM